MQRVGMLCLAPGLVNVPGLIGADEGNPKLATCLEVLMRANVHQKRSFQAINYQLATPLGSAAYVTA